MSPPREQPDLPPRSTVVGGRWIVAATLSLFLVVPAFVVAVWLLVTPHGQPTPDYRDVPLVWAERAGWPRDRFTLFKSLERGMMAAARTNETYKDLGFHVTPEHQAAVRRCIDLARQPRDRFMTEETLAALREVRQAHPDVFYAHFLAGLWHSLHGRGGEADAAFTAAFEHAPAALLRRYVGPGGTPAASRDVPTLVVAADQIVDDRLDRSLELVYPFLTTDAQGFIYLPTYKTILRHGDPSLPAGVVLAEQKPLWFTFFGNVGRLPDDTLP